MDNIDVEGVSKNDMMFFQNEVLRDIKKLDNKFNTKLDEKNSQLIEKISIIEQKISLITNQITELFNSIAIGKNNEDKIAKFMSFKLKAEESIFINKAKIQTLEKDLNYSIYKYDNMLNNNLFLPGLIGNSCKFPTLRDFIDYSNKTIKELLSFKEKEIVDLKLYKKKIENLIQQFQIHIETVQNKFNEYMNKKITELENKLIDRFKITDERINVLKIENGKYAKNLIEQTTNVKIEWEKLEQFEKKINEKLKDEILKFDNKSDNIKKLFNENNNEFKLIKQKFTKLSEFIKDVRFRKNLNQNVAMKEFKEMSNQIDFTKKQKLEEEGVYDYYNIEDIKIPEFLNTFDDEQLLKKLEEARRHKNGVYNKRIYSGKSYKSISNHPIIINNSKSQIKNQIEQKSNHKKNVSENLPNVNINSDPSRNNKNEPFIIFNSSYRDLTSFSDNSYN